MELFDHVKCTKMIMPELVRNIVKKSKVHIALEYLFFPRKLIRKVDGRKAEFQNPSFFYWYLYMSDKNDKNWWVEDKFSKIFCECLTSESVVYDIGAHLGYYTVLSALNEASVFSFEPSTKLYPSLKKTIKNNSLKKNVEILNYVVGNNRNNIELTNGVTGMDENNEYNIESIDKFTTDNPSPDIVKIDVEGAECAVLEGATDLFHKHPPILFIEVHDNEYISDIYGSQEQIYSILKSQNYIINCMYTTTEIPSLDVDPIPPNNRHFIIATRRPLSQHTPFVFD